MYEESAKGIFEDFRRQGVGGALVEVQAEVARHY